MLQASRPTLPCQGTKVWEQSGEILDPSAGETIPNVWLNSDDFTFSVRLTPSDPGAAHGGIILGRHTNGVPAGFGLGVTRSGHVFLNMYSDYTGYNQQPAPWTSDCVQDPSSVDHNGIWAGDLMSPTPLRRDVEQMVTIERVGLTLSLEVDGVVGCSVTVGSWNDAAGRVSPDALILGNENNGRNPFKGNLSAAYICTKQAVAAGAEEKEETGARRRPRRRPRRSSAPPAINEEKAEEEAGPITAAEALAAPETNEEKAEEIVGTITAAEALTPPEAPRDEAGRHLR